MNTEEEKEIKPDLYYWLFGLYIALILSGFLYAVVSLFTSLWWTGCIVLFIYLWAASTIHFYMKDKNEEDER